VISKDGADALRQMAQRPIVVTIDLHRGHLDPAVATLPLPEAASAALVARTVPLLDRFRGMGIPVVHVVTSYRDRDEILSNRYWRFQAGREDSPRRQIAEHNLEWLPGTELMPGIARPGDALIATKKRYDCFIGTDLEFILRSGEHDAVLLLGVNTNSCVIATAIAMSVRDWAVFLVEDGIDTMLGQALHDAAEAVIDASFGWIVDGDTAVGVLRERSTAAGSAVAEAGDTAADPS
jgi:nicotinamidase-related amidase